MKAVGALILSLGNTSGGTYFYQLFQRDGFICPFTGLYFRGPSRHVVARTVHILPFSFHDKVRAAAL